MNTFFKIIGLLVLISFTRNIEAQNHLTTIPDYFSSYSFQHKYYSAIKESLLKNLNERPIAQVIVMPSFSNKYVVYVDSSNKEYFLKYRTIEQKIWKVYYDQYPANKLQELPFIEFKKQISKELALTLNELFFEFTYQTHYSEVDYIIGPDGKKTRTISHNLDGENYYFIAFYDGIGTRGGVTFTPQKDTLMAELVGISNKMVNICKNNTDEGALLASAKNLYIKITK